MVLAITEKLGICCCGPRYDQNIKEGKLGGAKVIQGQTSLRTTLLVVGVAAALAAILGSLVYFNQLSVSLNSIGTLGQNPAFWMMVGGGAAALVSIALGVVQLSVSRARMKAPTDEPEQHI